MMLQLSEWLEANKIDYRTVDNEVIEITGFGKAFIADLTGVKSIFRGTKDQLVFNLMENPQILIDEEIFYVVFPFGRNWYYFDLREEFKFNLLKYVGSRKQPEVNIPFVNLGIHTPYELLNGSGDLTAWIKKAKQLGQTAIGICDRNTMAATLSLQKECAKAGVKYVFGYTFDLLHDGEKTEMKLYCQSQKGLRNLLRIQKIINVDSKDATIGIKDLLAHAAGNALVFGTLSSYWINQNLHYVEQMRHSFDGVYYQVDLSEYKAERIDAEVLKAVDYFFKTLYLPEFRNFVIEPILICDTYYLDKDDARNKIILNKIASGAAHKQSEDHYFKDIDEHYTTLKNLFDSDKWNIDELFKRMCSHTVDIAQRACASYDIGKMYMPQYIMLDDERVKYNTRFRMFHALLEEGLRRKIPPTLHEQYRQRLNEETYIIESTNNVDYFLIQYDMIREAKKRGIVTGIGRGSAGGSLVSYLLDIITIDPIKYGLIFSRFLVPERCGLHWVDEITAIAEDLELEPGESYIRIETDHGTLEVDKWAKLRIRRGEETLTLYANDLKDGDEILLDNRDRLWTLNDILQ